MRINLLTDLFIRGLGLLRLFITPLLLSTTEYGELGLISAIFLYANFADLGLQIHYEVISTMDPSHLKHELSTLLKKLIVRLVGSGLVLSLVTYLETKSFVVSIACFLFVFTLNIDTLFQIVLRQHQLYKRLAVSLLVQNILLTALIYPVAATFRVPGILFLQALVPLLSISISLYSVNEMTKRHDVKIPAGHGLDNEMTFWLLIGQIQMMVWITCDRFFLAKTIGLSDLGLWNLGNMAGGVLLGYANTYGTLKLAQWKKNAERKFEKKFLLSFIGIYLAGAAGIYLSTHLFLKKYTPGVPWNISWLTVMLLISLVFIMDAYARSQMKNAADTKKWLLQKLYAQIGGALVILIFYKILNLDPRLALEIGIIFSFLLVFIFTTKRITHHV